MDRRAGALIGSFVFFCRSEMPGPEPRYFRRV
jgi:hypothetical protein